MNDINNPLEDIKVQSALKSEEMKLSYRKTNNPKDVNILDYTVIAALEKQIPKKPVYKHDCPMCKQLLIDRYDNSKYMYCTDCGQKIDWEE